MFYSKFDVFNIFALNIDYGYKLKGTHNLCFGSKIRKKSVYAFTPQIYYIELGVEGVYFTWTCFPNETYHIT